MTFQELVTLARQGGIEELHVEKLEGDLFLYRAVTSAGSEVIQNESGGVLRPASLQDARKRLRHAGGFDGVPLYLVQQSPYDEMIGLEGEQEAHKAPMSLHTGT
ncbi:DUF6482 family protein [Salinicola sp. JS01]|uniref:DUF6482 family protein n=1 Tax=Salinicola sp. JS01 TaxID=3050071 RepID=UPI00255C13A7|nr:DUF6482 family protein [Salinicola sp. JS01]WIX31591.1 DUF6482 family protein [Salinicola sp. JS01]